VPGFSHELISSETENILDRTDIDTLEAYPYPGMDTLYKLLKRQVQRIPNNDVMGTRVGDKYEWLNWRELDEIVENLSFGIENAGLTPQIEAEGKTWKFMGIQSKNRKEWQFVNLSGML